jgi:hypothetical protein
MTSKVFVELERIRRKCKVEELFLKSLFKKRGRRKITQHNHTHNITAIYCIISICCNIIIRTSALRVVISHGYSSFLAVSKSVISDIPQTTTGLTCEPHITSEQD